MNKMANQINSDHEIKCDNCERYLSFSPVFIKESGNSICGKCNVDIKQVTTRNKTYEALAKSCSFPCQFKSRGCDEQLPWEEAKQHEEGCIYRDVNCFESNCEWIGALISVKQHYVEKHPNNVLLLPLVVKPNINIDEDIKYLVATLENLFLVHIKYSVSTSILSYYTCFVGKSEYASNFDYVLRIWSEKGEIKSKISVQPICELYHPSKKNVITLDLNNLLSMGLISSYENCAFSLTIELKNNICVSRNCRSEITFKNIISNDSYCNSCYEKSNEASIKTIENRNQGVEITVAKHNHYFCPYYQWCKDCNKTIKDTPFNHYVNEHVPKEDVFYTSVVWIPSIAKNVTKIMVFHRFRYIFLINCICTSSESSSSNEFILSIYSNVPRSRINEFKCSFKYSSLEIISKGIQFDKFKEGDKYDWYVRHSFRNWNLSKRPTYNIEIKIIEQ